MGPFNSDGKDLSRRALDLYKDGIFPDWWSCTPTNGKKAFTTGWPDNPLQRELAIRTYLKQKSDGFGVVTGELSGGLIALDVDGPKADERLKEIAGDEYELPGEESTMSTTSGRTGRRQIFWRVPHSMLADLRKVNKLIFKEDGWEKAKGDANASDKDKEKKQHQELVLRFNRCQTVLPGSLHPKTGRRYKFLNYNAGRVAKAPRWVMEVLLPLCTPQFLSEKDLREMDEEIQGTQLPSKQIRGWFFKEGGEVQKRMRDKLQEVYRCERIDSTWRVKGDGVHLQNYCPWHGGNSGTSFQINQENGNWFCFGCWVGGDIVDYRHRLALNDISAERPQGADLENIVSELATELGFNYPEDARPINVNKEVPRISMSAKEFHEKLCEIADEEWNPASRLDRMAVLAADTGRRLSGRQCLEAMEEYRYYEDATRQNRDFKWWEGVEAKVPLIPNLLERPQQVILHSAPGVGKTSAALAIATAVGQGKQMKVRGIEVEIPKGPILWIQNDQNPAKLLEDLADNKIEIEKDHKWFIVKRGWQINHTMEFCAWIKEHKPALVVVDSIGSCSTKCQIEEKEKAFANPFYWYSEKNGDPGDGGFPPTTILWIHHDNKSGGMRGTDYLKASVDETWRMRHLTDEEKENLREQRINPNRCRFIQICKSRMDREGDRLLIERDENFSYSINDFTPTERREDNGQGDPDPTTTVLRLIKDDDNDGGDGLDAKTVWELLVEEQNKRGVKSPAARSVKRWLDRGVNRGMLVAQKRKKEGSKQPVAFYGLPNTPHTRAGGVNGSPLSNVPSTPFLQQEKTMDTSTEVSTVPEEVVHCSETVQPISEQVDLNSEITMDNGPEDEKVSIVISESQPVVSANNEQKTASECVLGADELSKNEGVTYSPDPRPLHQPKNDFDDDF